MIEIGTLKRQLNKFPDNYLVAAIEDDESSWVGIYKDMNGLERKPIGFISTFGGLTAILKSGSDELEDITDVEIVVCDSM